MHRGRSEESGHCCKARFKGETQRVCIGVSPLGQASYISSSIERRLVWRSFSDFDDYLYNAGFNYIAFFADRDSDNFEGATTTTFTSECWSNGASSSTVTNISSRRGSTTTGSTS